MAIWILGAADPEMTLIENLLISAGETVVYATVGGRRVHPGNAYGADVPSEAYAGPVYLVECGIPGHFPDAVVVDHHRQGDPGYGRLPEEFLQASSIGQVIAILTRHGKIDIDTFGVGHADYHLPAGEWYDDEDPAEISLGEGFGRNISPDIVNAAAADHCLGAAYRGKCPGVYPDELMRWRIQTRAAFQGRSADRLLVDVNNARKILREAVWVPGDHEHDEHVRWSYVDLRGRSIPELPEAAAREDIPFIADMIDRDGRRKVVIQAAPPELVTRFLNGEIVSGLTDTYGDPARGFAGGYLA